MSVSDDLWEKRLDSLCAGIESRILEINNRLKTSNIDDYDRQKITATTKVLIRLFYFTKEIFPYFQNGNIKFEPEYSREHVMSTVLEQVGYDLETLSRVAHDQFTIGGKNILRKADFLADDALKVAEKLGFITATPVVLSYFQKSFTVRIIPYANVLMLGIPFSTRGVEQDFLAIPHEVGHYVFWKGVKGEFISDKLLNYKDLKKTEWLPRWLEELFADIYGAYVGGPFIALSFQDLGLQNLPKDIVEDDEDHPSAVLRPYIYAKALNKAGLEDSAKLLYTLWDGRRAEFSKKHGPIIKREGRADRDFNNIYLSNGNPYPIMANSDHGNNGHGKGAMIEGLGTEASEQPVDLAINKIASLFSQVEEENRGIWETIIYAMEDLLDLENDNSQGNLTEQEINVRKNAKDFLSLNRQTALSDVVNERMKAVQDSIYDYFRIAIGNIPGREQVGNSFDVKMPQGDIKIELPKEFQNLIVSWEKRANSEEKWLRVWEAGGWTTEGPDCNNTTGSC